MVRRVRKRRHGRERDDGLLHERNTEGERDSLRAQTGTAGRFQARAKEGRRRGGSAGFWWWLLLRAGCAYFLRRACSLSLPWPKALGGWCATLEFAVRSDPAWQFNGPNDNLLRDRQVLSRRSSEACDQPPRHVYRIGGSRIRARTRTLNSQRLSAVHDHRVGQAEAWYMARGADGRRRPTWTCASVNEEL